MCWNTTKRRVRYAPVHNSYRATPFSASLLVVKGLWFIGKIQYLLRRLKTNICRRRVNDSQLIFILLERSTPQSMYCKTFSSIQSGVNPTIKKLGSLVILKANHVRFTRLSCVPAICWEALLLRCPNGSQHGLHQNHPPLGTIKLT